jgi:hypothetical protein
MADLIVVIHLVFILFVVAGGLLVLWRRKIIWVHIPAVIWGVVIELTGWICPLTPLENYFRIKAGGVGYSSGFVENYIIPIVYPIGLTRGIQLALGLVVIAINILVYWRIFSLIRPGK